MSEGPRVVVSGYYGFGNAGDEAVLAALADVFRAAMPGVSLSVASGDPEATRRLHGVDAFNRCRWREFRAELRRCDVFVSGGGSLFQDVTSRASIYYYLGTLVLAAMCRRPVVICGQGIGPIQAKPARLMTAALLNRARLITVRDPCSVETLRALGVRRPPVRLTADPVFALNPAPAERAEAVLRQAGVDPGRPYVAFALRPWEGAGEGAVGAWAEAAQSVQRDLGAQVLFVPMHPPGDVEMAEAVAARTGGPTAVLRETLGPRELMAVIGRAALVAGLRLHALIFAAVQAVPVVAVSYDPKIDGFLRLLERTPAGKAASIRGCALSRAIQETWVRREEESLSLRRHAAALREKALENGSLLASLVP